MEFETNLTWQSVRKTVFAVNPEFARIIDQIDPSSSLTFVRAKYKYGEYFCRQGKFYVPEQFSKIGQQLSYSVFPLGIVTQKAFEIFLYDQEEMVPETIFYPGRIFGAFEAAGFFTETPIMSIWDGQAGSRLIFSLPRITDQIGLERLRKFYQLNYFPLAKKLDHFDFFKAITLSPKFDQDWEGELVLFTDQWFKSRTQKAILQKFREYILEIAFKQISSYLNSIQIDQLIQKFAQTRHLQSSLKRQLLYFHQILKNIIEIALGKAPGLEVCSEDNGDEFLPLQGLQKALIEIYELKHYQPTFMRMATVPPFNHMPEKNKISYYSLAYPHFSKLKHSNKGTIMQDIKQIKLLLDTFLAEINMPDLEKIISRLKYFHIETDSDNTTLNSREIPKFDPHILSQRYAHLEFCSSAVFWRGCIQFYSG